MNEEQTPEPQPQPIVEPSERKRLERLPEDALADLHEQIRITPDQPTRIKRHMEETWKGDQYSEVTASLGGYRNYIEKNLERIIKDYDLKKQALIPIDSQMKAVIDTVSDPKANLSDKRASLTDLFNVCQQRQKLLIDAQAAGSLDPQKEALIQTGIRAQVLIIEKLTVLQEAMNYDQQLEHIADFEEYTGTMLTAVNNVYKKVHGQTNGQFEMDLEKMLTEIMENYTLAKKKLAANTAPK